MSAPDPWPEVPPVSFDADICRLLKLKLRTFQKLRKARAFSIPELPRLDKRHRYSRRDVIAFLERAENAPVLVRRRA